MKESTLVSGKYIDVDEALSEQRISEHPRRSAWQTSKQP